VDTEDFEKKETIICNWGRARVMRLTGEGRGEEGAFMKANLGWKKGSTLVSYHFSKRPSKVSVQKKEEGGGERAA